jgi:hypothetical protein
MKRRNQVSSETRSVAIMALRGTAGFRIARNPDKTGSFMARMHTH